jgi:hypothetical protein
LLLSNTTSPQDSTPTGTREPTQASPDQILLPRLEGIFDQELLRESDGHVGRMVMGELAGLTDEVDVVGYCNGLRNEYDFGEIGRAAISLENAGFNWRAADTITDILESAKLLPDYETH